MVCCLKQKTVYEWRISDWSSDVCSSDLVQRQQTYLVVSDRFIITERKLQQCVFTEVRIPVNGRTFSRRWVSVKLRDVHIIVQVVIVQIVWLLQGLVLPKCKVVRIRSPGLQTRYRTHVPNQISGRLEQFLIIAAIPGNIGRAHV